MSELQLTLSSLKEWERNPRTIDDDAFGGLGKSMERFGDLSGITWNKRLGALVCGHQRCKQLAKQAEGDPRVLMVTDDQGVIVVDDKAWPVRIVDWDEQTHAAANVAANNPFIAGEFSDDLESLLEELGADDDQLLTDLRLDDLAADLGLLDQSDELVDVEPKLDRAEELREKWGTELGQLWIIEGKQTHRLLCGDSTNSDHVSKLFDRAKADLVFTSPPYAQQRDYDKNSQVDLSDWDSLMRGVFAAIPAHDKTQILVNLGLIHCANEWVPYWDGWIEWMRSQKWRRFALYVWDQGWGLPGDWNGRLAPCFEFIFHFNRQSIKASKFVKSKLAGKSTTGKQGLRGKDGQPTRFNDAVGSNGEYTYPKTKIADAVIRENRHCGDNRGHSAVYSINLAKHVLRSWPGKIYDPFAGSSTTGLAAEQIQRESFQIEISPAYVAVSLQRMQDAGCRCTLAE